MRPANSTMMRLSLAVAMMAMCCLAANSTALCAFPSGLSTTDATVFTTLEATACPQASLCHRNFCSCIGAPSISSCMLSGNGTAECSVIQGCLFTFVNCIRNASELVQCTSLVPLHTMLLEAEATGNYVNSSGRKACLYGTCVLGAVAAGNRSCTFDGNAVCSSQVSYSAPLLLRGTWTALFAVQDRVTAMRTALQIDLSAAAGIPVEVTSVFQRSVCRGQFLSVLVAELRIPNFGFTSSEVQGLITKLYRADPTKIVPNTTAAYLTLTSAARPFDIIGISSGAAQSGGVVDSTTAFENLLQSVDCALETAVNYASAAANVRCESLEICSRCSVLACADEPFATGNTTCGPGNGGNSCQCTKRLQDQSTIRLPFTAARSRIEQLATNDMKAFVCSTSDAAQILDNGVSAAQQVIGAASGASRIYPGIPETRTSSGQCSGYDPRQRPWYSSATSGPKDFAFLIDKGGTTDVVLDTTVKPFMQAIMKTLTEDDWFVIGEHDDDPNWLLGYTALRRATQANIDDVVSAIIAIDDRPGKDASTGFEMVFNQLRQTVSVGNTSGCQRVIVYVTDGQQHAKSPTQVAATIETGQRALDAAGLPRAMVFVFTVDASHETWGQELACLAGGLWSPLGRSDTDAGYIDKAQIYYNFYARGVVSSEVRWTAVYQDAFGAGSIVSAARAYYLSDPSTSTPVLGGAVALDLPISLITQTGTSLNAALAEIRQRSSTCSDFVASDCELESLRASVGHECPAFRPTTRCTAGNSTVQKSCPKLTNDLVQSVRPFCDTNAASTRSNNERVCCISDECERLQVPEVSSASEAKRSLICVAIVLVVVVMIPALLS